MGDYSQLPTFHPRSIMAFTFEKLIVYHKAISCADCICAITEKFPRGCGFLSDQLNRASVSIAVNISEGNGRFALPHRKNFFMIAKGPVQECVALLVTGFRRKLVALDIHCRLRSDMEETSKMPSGLINGLENRKA